MSLDRITINPEVMSGQPCIRGLRIPVSFILRLLASGKTVHQILDDYPELEKEDIRQVQSDECRRRLQRAWRQPCAPFRACTSPRPRPCWSACSAISTSGRGSGYKPMLQICVHLRFYIFKDVFTISP